MSLCPPDTTQPHYGAHLGDVGYWMPYVSGVLDRHGLPATSIEAPFVGTFPTFLAGGVVVKLFGDVFEGGQRFTTELAMGLLLQDDPLIPVPTVIHSGQLFDGGERWSWPYLIMERLTGTAIREAQVGRSTLIRTTADLGAATTHLHQLSAPTRMSHDKLPELRSEAADRHRRQGLPERLVEQIPAFLSNASDQRVLVHADLTADHLWLDDHGLVGIIDWADALVADPWYELVAVRLDGLGNDQGLLAAFLEAYGWEKQDEFAIRSLQGALEFEYDTLEAALERVDLSRVTTLEEIAPLISG